jgi:DNA-binding PadR family transcriptional regulator
MNQKNKYLLKRNIWVPYEMLDSKAFKELSAKGIQVLLRFMQKRTWNKRRRKGVEYCNTGLAFTYEEAQYLGISKSRFNEIIRQLVELGFIEVEHQGGAYGRDFSRYAYSERWKAYGTDHFKEIVKRRIVLPGRDVHSRKLRKENKVTASRNVNGNGDDAGYRKTVTVRETPNSPEMPADKGIDADSPIF